MLHLIYWSLTLFVKEYRCGEWSDSIFYEIRILFSEISADSHRNIWKCNYYVLVNIFKFKSFIHAEKQPEKPFKTGTMNFLIETWLSAEHRPSSYWEGTKKIRKVALNEVNEYYRHSEPFTMGSLWSNSNVKILKMFPVTALSSFCMNLNISTVSAEPRHGVSHYFWESRSRLLAASCLHHAQF